MDKFLIFVRQFPVKRFSKGEIILVQGEVPRSVYVIKRGILKTYNLTSQGEEKPISFDVVGDIVPLTWAFKKLRHSQFYFEAFTPCELYCLPPQELIDFVQAHKEVSYALLDTFILDYMHFQMRINALEQSKASSKVINTLHFLCLRFGRDTQSNVVKIQIPLTQQDLANFMGLTRETTGIELKKLQRSGVLTYRRQSYMIRTDKLDALLDEDYDPGQINLSQSVII